MTTTQTPTDPETVRALVRDHYGEVAKQRTGCCGPATPCGTSATVLGYGDADVAAAPQAELGLGCGNPGALAALAPGETVLDLGAGGGFDCFLAARQVGPTGRVIGVDMTPDMVTLARANAAKLAATNVEFRLGEIEHLPVVDASIDVILSNCVINLSPDKRAVFAEAWRVLKPGGRLAISDVVTVAEIPAALRAEAAALTGCITGAATIDEVRRALVAQGFEEVAVEPTAASSSIVNGWMPGADRYVAAAAITARKPGPRAASCCGPECCA